MCGVYAWGFGKGEYMPQGLQCWDSSGKLIVDIGDYNCRYHGEITVNYPANVWYKDVPYSGITQTGSFAVTVSTSAELDGPFATPCKTYNGGIRIFSIFRYSSPVTLKIRVYSFI